MEIEKDALIEAIEILNLVPSRPGIPSSEFIRVSETKDELTLALSSDIYGEVRVKKQGDFPVPVPFLLDRRLFVPFVSTKTKQKAPFKFESLEVTKGKEVTKQLRVKHGRRKAMFTEVPEITGYGQLTPDKQHHKLSFTDSQRALISCALVCATQDTAVPHLNTVVLYKDTILSSNGTSIFIGNTKTPAEKITLPLYIISLLSHEKVKEIRLGKTKILLDFSCGSLLQTLPDKASEDFPVQSLYKIRDKVKDYPSALSIEAKQLFDTMDRFKTYMAGWAKQDRSLVLRGLKGKEFLTLSAGVMHLQIAENLSIAKPLTTDVKIDLALDDVLPAFKFVSTQADNVLRISYSDEESSPYCFKTKDLQMFFSRKAKK